MITGAFIALYISFTSLVFGYDEAELIFVGDAMQHARQLEAATAGNSYDYSACFESIAPIIKSADYAVVNLETPVGEGHHSGYPCFYAPTAFADALAEAGFDMMLTANNHTLDRGAKGLRSTINHLDSKKIDHIGTYTSDSARMASLPFVKEVGHFKIGFVNCTYGTNGISPRDGVIVDYIDREHVKADVDAARAAGAELIVVAVHWGDEYHLLPNNSQRYFADFLEAIGVDMIIGSHPHVIQPMEFRPNRYYPERNILIVYSLGNFISAMRTADTRGGALVRVKLFRGDDRKANVQSANYKLLFTQPGSSPKDNFRVLEVDSVKETVWQGHADKFARRARDIFDKHNIDVTEY